MLLFPTRSDVDFVAEPNLDGCIGRLTITWLDSEDKLHRHVVDWPYGALPEEVTTLANNLVQQLIGAEDIPPF